MNYRWDWNALAGCCESSAAKNQDSGAVSGTDERACADLTVAYAVMIRPLLWHGSRRADCEYPDGTTIGEKR